MSTENEDTVEASPVGVDATLQGAESQKAVIDGWWEWAGRLVEAETEQEALEMLDATFGKERQPYGVTPAERTPCPGEKFVHVRHVAIGALGEGEGKIETRVVFGRR